jgi:transglutaminase-like putative cysteine protease
MLKKSIIFILILLTTTLVLSSVVMAGTGGVSINGNDRNKGLVQVSYLGNASEKIKVMISKGETKYYYPLKPDGVLVGFPLQMGDGYYKVSVLKNVGGSKYASLKSTTVNVKMEDPNSVYLNSIQTISWTPESEAVKKNLELIGLETDYSKRIALSYGFTVENVRYDYEKVKTLTSDYTPDPDSTLKVLKGICYDYSSLFAAMKRSEGIPVKLVKGYAKGLEGYHAWNEVFIDGKWVVVDTTFDAAYYKARMKYDFMKKTTDYKKVYEY